jgi:ubiquinone/menaquinone biosynthesis C-methylase UbiE
MASVEAQAKAQFDRQAAHYNERWASWSDESLRRVLELADPRPEWRALDIATGTGFTALALAPHVAAVVGSDLSPGMLAEAAKRAAERGVTNAEWVEAPADTQPFPDAAFDLVTARIAPHHFPDPVAFVREVARVLKPGGVFVLGDTTVPDGDPEAAAWQNAVEKERDPSHVRNLPPSEWRALCEAAGLTVTDCEAKAGAITIALSAWLETAGADAARSERVRRLFAETPASARAHFAVETDEDGETRFSWQRVAVRAVK